MAVMAIAVPVGDGLPHLFPNGDMLRQPSYSRIRSRNGPRTTAALEPRSNRWSEQKEFRTRRWINIPCPHPLRLQAFLRPSIYIFPFPAYSIPSAHFPRTEVVRTTTVGQTTATTIATLPSHCTAHLTTTACLSSLHHSPSIGTCVQRDNRLQSAAHPTPQRGRHQPPPLRLRSTISTPVRCVPHQLYILIADL